MTQVAILDNLTGVGIHVITSLTRVICLLRARAHSLTTLPAPVLGSCIFRKFFLSHIAPRSTPLDTVRTNLFPLPQHFLPSLHNMAVYKETSGGSRAHCFPTDSTQLLYMAAGTKRLCILGILWFKGQRFKLWNLESLEGLRNLSPMARQGNCLPPAFTALATLATSRR